jgi:hypothetical protein
MTSSGAIHPSVVAYEAARLTAQSSHSWGERVTTLFLRLGTYAHDPQVLSASPLADMTIACIKGLLDCGFLRPGTTLRSLRPA